MLKIKVTMMWWSQIDSNTYITYIMTSNYTYLSFYLMSNFNAKYILNLNCTLVEVFLLALNIIMQT